MDIQFETGLLKVDEDSISLQWDGNNVSMYRWQIGKVDVVTSKELKHQPWIYGFRLGAISIIPFILAFVVDSSTMSWIAAIMMIVAVFIFFGDLVLAGLFGIEIVRSMLMNIVGREFTEVRIQNTDGQDINFYILEEEKSKARSIADLRKEKAVQIKEPIQQENTISQIEKLHELKEKGVITEEEFNRKKSELL